MPTISMSDLMNSDIGRAFNAQEMARKEQEAIKPMAGRRGKRSLEVSKTLILNFIAEAKEPVTFLEICDHLERKPSPHFRIILRDLMAAGDVVQEMDYGAGPLLPRFLYSLAKR
jgi:hypothetical protein